MEALQKKRIEKIIIADICSMAGYNRSTFYTYFKDIYDVLGAVEGELISADRFKKIIVDNLIKKSDLKGAFALLIELFEECDEHFSVLLGPGGDPAFREKLLLQLSPNFESIPPLGTSARLRYVLEYQNAGVVMTLAKWHQRGKDISPEELVEILLELSCCGTQNVLKKELDCEPPA